MAFFYLASPYSNFELGKEKAHAMILEQAARMIAAGHNIYSPIVHCVPIYDTGRSIYATGVFESDSAFTWSDSALTWSQHNKAMLSSADGLIICTMHGWKNSQGVALEIEWAHELHKPIFFCAPGSTEYKVAGDPGFNRNVP